MDRPGAPTRGFAAAALVVLLALPLAGCVNPFEEKRDIPRLHVDVDVAAYDSDNNGKTDGIRIELRTAGRSDNATASTAPFVGTEARLLRNGDDNVTVFRDAARVVNPGGRGVGTLALHEPLYLLGNPGNNRITLNLSKTVTLPSGALHDIFVEINRTIPVTELRDTEVDGTLVVETYSRDGDQLQDGFKFELKGSTKAPFPRAQVVVLIGTTPTLLYKDAARSDANVMRDDDIISNGELFFADGLTGDNRLIVRIRATEMFNRVLNLQQ